MPMHSKKPKKSTPSDWDADLRDKFLGITSQAATEALQFPARKRVKRQCADTRVDLLQLAQVPAPHALLPLSETRLITRKPKARRDSNPFRYISTMVAAVCLGVVVGLAALHGKSDALNRIGTGAATLTAVVIDSYTPKYDRNALMQEAEFATAKAGVVTTPVATATIRASDDGRMATLEGSALTDTTMN